VINLRQSVYVLCSDKTEPIGTAFVIAPTMVLSAFHNMIDPTTNKMDRNGILVIGIERRRDGSKHPEANTRIPVTIAYYCTSEDWVLFSRTDGLLFSPEDIVPVCPNHDLPQIGSIQIHHFPVDLFNSGEIDALKALLVNKDIGYYTEHKVLVQNGLFSGSSGGLYAFNGRAIAMHLESVNSAMTVDDIARQYPDLADLACVGAASDSNVACYAGLAQGIVICKFKRLMARIFKNQ
jgi:hypothetical protein